MGFGSGGGFTPSPNIVPGSTQTGTDKDTDVHQFTGSVDITGSLTLNGSSITGGGGGGTPGGANTQIQYNDGGSFGGASSLVYDDANNHVGIGVSDPDVILEVLDTSTQQKWSYDADSFATITVADGGDTTIAASENGNITIDADDLTLVAAGGQVKVQRPGSSDRLQFDISTSTALIDNPTNNDIAFRLGSGLKEIARFDQSEGALLMSGTVGTYPQGNAPIHFRDTATTINSPAANRLAINAPTLEVTGTLHLSSSTEGDTVFKVDVFHQTNQGFAIVDSGGAAYATINKTAQTTYPLDIGGNARAQTFLSTVNGTSYGYRLGQDLHHLYSDGGTVTLDVKLDNDVVLITGSGGNLGIGTSAPLQTLSVSGSAAFSGAIGSTSIQTIDVTDGLVNSTSGITIIDATGLANNAFYTYGISDGSFVGQRKELLFKCNFGGAIVNTNGVEVTGSNIAVATVGATVGNLVLSGSDQGGGYFQSLRGAAQLFWDGSKWEVLGTEATQYSGT
jgi:hypothetical protein